MIEQLEGRVFLSADVEAGILTVTGTSGNDSIQVIKRGAAVIVREGSSITRFHKNRDQIQKIVVNGLGGDDRIKINANLGATVDGGEGNDRIDGGAGADLLLGGAGNDRMVGNRGNDSISGGAGRDKLFGRAGDDAIDAHDNEGDRLSGGTGNDKARADVPGDEGRNIEEYVTVELVKSASGEMLRLASFPTGGNLYINNAGAVVGSTITSGTFRFAGNASLAGKNLSVINPGAMNLNSGTLTFVNTGAQGVALGNTGATFSAGLDRINLGAGTLTVSGVQVYAGGLNAAKNSLYDAIISANNTLAGGAVTLNLNSGIGLVKMGNDIVIRPTRIGDINLDGSVTISDFIDLASNFNTGGAVTWEEGDINNDGNVTISDFIDLARRFNSGSNFSNSHAGAGYDISVGDYQPLASFATSIVVDPTLTRT
jgi:hypothetical protein